MRLNADYFRKLRMLLASLFSDQPSFMNISRATLSKEGFLSLNLATAPFNAWTSILNVAEAEDKVADILKMAIEMRDQNEAIQVLQQTYFQNVLPGQASIELKERQHIPGQPVEILLVYDRADENQAKQLRNHLSIYKMNKKLNWTNLDSDTTEDKYDIILLLISSSFFSEDNNCMTTAVMASKLKLPLVPILISTCDWERVDVIKDIVPLPKKRKFVSDETYWTNEPQAYTNIGKDILDLVITIDPALS